MSESSPTGTGPLSSLRRILDTVLAAIQNRLELFTVEFQVEKYRLVELLALTAGVIFLGTVAATLVVIALVLVFPEDQRIYVVGALAVICLVGAVWAVVRLRARLKTPPPFSETLAQLKKDREWFTSLK